MPLQTDEQQILKLFEEGDRAIVSADVAELTRIYTDDYLQYDETGKAFNKQDLLNTLSDGKIRYISMISTGRKVRVLTPEIAVVHGSEIDQVEQDGTRSTVRYLYMDVVAKREGHWRIVASQLARAQPTTET